MGVLVQSLRVDGDRHPGLARLAFVFVSQEVFVGDDIGPMVTARVMHAEQHLAETGQAGQGFKSLGGQGRNAKHDDAGRQALGGGVQVIDAFDKTLVDPGTALRHAFLTHVQQQRAP